MSSAVIWTGVALLLLGLAVLLWTRRRWASSGLPHGRIVYSDTGAWERVQEPLYSRRHRLTGRPDYLVQAGETVVPVEVKSGRAPSEPYPGHLLQLAAYCLLVEEQFGARPPHGLIHYDDATFQIPFDRPLRRQLLDTLDEMRQAYSRGWADRDHDSPQKCLRCGQRDNCDQRLV